jgi:hypothetical protein
VRYHGVHAVVKALHVDVEDAVEIRLGRFFQIGDLRDAGVVDEDVDAFRGRELPECFCYGCVTRDVALLSFRVAARYRDFPRGALGGFEIDIENSDSCACLRESLCDGFANTAAAAGDDGRFSIETKGVLRGCGGQSETPLFQGMKSSCASSSARVRTSPPAT